MFKLDCPLTLNLLTILWSPLVSMYHSLCSCPPLVPLLSSLVPSRPSRYGESGAHKMTNHMIDHIDVAALDEVRGMRNEELIMRNEE